MKTKSSKWCPRLLPGSTRQRHRRGSRDPRPHPTSNLSELRVSTARAFLTSSSSATTSCSEPRGHTSTEPCVAPLDPTRQSSKKGGTFDLIARPSHDDDLQ